MYFALGFLVAGLLTLMFLPAFWRRAMRLSMRRLQMHAPMSMEEVAAERDLLRAEFALQERRLEQEIEAVRASKAQDLIEIGRHAARIADLDGRLNTAQARVRDLEVEIAQARKTVTERTELLSSTELALHEMTERAENWVERLRHLQSDNEELGRQTEIVQSRVTAHEAKIANLHQQNSDLERDLRETRDKLAEVAAEAERLAEADAKLVESTAELDATRIAQLTLEQTLDEARANMKAFEQRHEEEVEHLESALRIARAEARDSADRLEIARADNSMLQGAIDALRKEHVLLREAQAARSAASHEAKLREVKSEPLNERDVAALRQAIAEMADRIEETAQAERLPMHAKRAL